MSSRTETTLNKYTHVNREKYFWSVCSKSMLPIFYKVESLIKYYAVKKLS